MQKYDAILVLGSGITEDGAIPASARSRIDKARALFDRGVADYLILSGKWAYNLSHTPPWTEAAAMASYAREVGFPESAIILEEDSTTTVSNICHVKKEILIPSNWHAVLLVSYPPYTERNLLNLRKVLGPDYRADIVEADFRFAPDKAKELAQKEAEKMKIAREFLAQFIDGDHETILAAATQELQEKYLK